MATAQDYLQSVLANVSQLQKLTPEQLKEVKTDLAHLDETVENLTDDIMEQFS